MLLKDKIILVVYVGCKGMTISEASRVLVNVSNHFDRLKDESAEIITLLDSSMDPPSYRMDCINPKHLTQEEQERLSASLDKFLKNMNEYDTVGSEQK